MKLHTKISLGLCMAALSATSAQALILYGASGPGLGAAQAAEAAFLSTLSAGYLTEDFEGFTAGAPQSASIATSVGTFTRVAAGSGGLCDTGSYDCDDGLGILNAGTSPFNGRFATSPDNWLDSFDATKVRFDLDVISGNAVGFYMTDPNDQGGRMDFKLKDGSSGSLLIDDIFGSPEGSGSVFYLTFYADAGIDSIKFLVDDPDDGYGIDDVTVGTVPEPGSLALMGLGLIGLAFTRRNTR